MLEKWSELVIGKRSRWVTLLVWVALAALLTVLLPAVGEKEENNAPNLEETSPSVLAAELIKEQYPSSSGIPALLVWHREGGLTAEDYRVIQELARSLTDKPLAAQEEMIPLHQLPSPALAQMASEDKTTFVLPVAFKEATPTEILKDNLDAIQERTRSISTSDPFAADLGDASVLSARITGPVGISVDATGLFQGADVSLLIATVLLVLILLLLIYRSPILAIIPLVGVGFAYLVTSPVLGWMAGEGWITVDGQAISIMTVLLFGAGTDYCLFFISHFRQELRREQDKLAALRRAFKDASGAIAMSGFTVVLSLFALLAAKYGAYHRFAVPFSLSIFIMGLVSLTLIPALLAIIGRASFYPFIPRTEEMERERARARVKNKIFKPSKAQSGPGHAIGRLVVTRPWTVVICCVVLLGGLAGFAPQIKFTYDLLSSFPKDMPSSEGFAMISEAYSPGDLAPVTVIVQTEGKEAEVEKLLAAQPLVAHVSEAVPGVSDPNLLSYTASLSINPYSQQAMDAIPKLRAKLEQALEEAGITQAAANVWIGGQTAAQHDAEQLTIRDMKVVIPLVIVLIMILLVAYLRSVTAMLYLIGTVVLSYGSALGLGWVILHYGMGVEAIQGAIPLYAFAFLVALGEDYNIFMISSIWSKRKSMPLRQAIREGVAETGGVITSAGLILAATFAVLATLPIQVLVQFGLITAIGVLMDTFVVRPFLVPAITALLGKTAFWPGKAELIAESSTDRTPG